MTALTQESLEDAIMRLASQVESMEERFTMRPTHLIVPPAIYRRLIWRPPIKMARSVRGRKKAIYKRAQPVLWKMMRGTR